MGYCYDASGRLCCDYCDNAGGVKRKNCPHGYCPAIACCDREECKKKLANYRKTHCRCKCKERSDEFAAFAQERKDLLAAGRAVRCAALGKDGNCVHVLFEKQGGVTVGYFMSAETYHAFPLLVNRTVEDYAAVGQLLDAPSSFYEAN